MQQRDVEEKRKDKELRYQQMTRMYADVFGSEKGMLVLDDILSKGYFYTTTFTGDNRGMFLEGKRDLSLYIMKRVNSGDTNIMMKIMAENQKLKLERDAK